MTKKQYYTDAYHQSFSAHIHEITPHANGTCDVVLSETYFYPESGGQPADHGRIAGIPVTQITIRSADQAVIHTLSQHIEAKLNNMVTGEIDWPRRFNHMQQHTGQHILSRAFINLFDSDTIGFHLSSEYCSIDLDRNNFTPADIMQAEQLANQIIWDNRPIYIRFVSHEQAAKLPLRKRPPVQSDTMRLIEIEGFDLNACGGTHVAHTGEVGQIKVIKVERRKQKLRLMFLCGSRAWHDYHTKNKILTDLGNELTTGQDRLLETVQKLRQEIKEKNKTLKKQNQILSNLEVNRLKEAMTSVQGINWIVHTYNKGEREIGSLRPLANMLTPKTGATVVLLGLAGNNNAQLIFKRSADLKQIDLTETIQQVLPLLNAQTGGGTVDFAQAGGLQASTDQLNQAILKAQTIILESLG